jgi:hypothetical protein
MFGFIKSFWKFMNEPASDAEIQALRQMMDINMRTAQMGMLVNQISHGQPVIVQPPIPRQI